MPNSSGIQRSCSGFRHSNGREKHLRDLVSDVLDLAKIEAGHLTVEPAWFDLEPLLLEIEKWAMPSPGTAA